MSLSRRMSTHGSSDLFAVQPSRRHGTQMSLETFRISSECIASNYDYLNRNAFLCYYLNNNNNNNKLRCLCLTEMKTDRTRNGMSGLWCQVSSLTGSALWRMQLTFPYNTQLGAVPYRMIIKQCISSTFYCSSLAV